MHVTVADTVPNPDGYGGGAWYVMCRHGGCGWGKEGVYHPQQSEASAIRLAHALGSHHEQEKNG